MILPLHVVLHDRENMAVKSEASTSDRCLQVEVPPGISIALDLPEGRGIVSTRKFSKGSEIFTDQPFCHAIKSERHDDFCTSCLSKASPIWLAVVSYVTSDCCYDFCKLIRISASNRHVWWP